MFHDIVVRLGDFGVYRLWEKLSEHLHLEFPHSNGLGVLFPKGCPLAFRAVLEHKEELVAHYNRRELTSRESHLDEEWEARKMYAIPDQVYPKTINWVMDCTAFDRSLIPEFYKTIYPGETLRLEAPGGFDPPRWASECISTRPSSLSSRTGAS